MKANEPVTSQTPKKRRRSSGVGKQGWQAVFLEALSKVPNITVACEQAHIARETAYRERDKNEQFREDWETALKHGIELLEYNCWRRASIGVKRGVWMKGEDGKPIKVEEISDYSDTLAIFLLKAHNPAKYRETFRTEISGPVGGKIEIEIKQAQPIDHAGLERVASQVFGLPLPDHNGESLHLPEAGTETSLVPEPDRT